MAEAQQNFNFVIGVIDRALTPIRAIAAAVTGATHETEKAGHAAHGAAKHVGEITHHTRGIMALGAHIHILRGHFGELNAGIAEVGHSITEFLPMLGALGAAGSLVGLFELTEHVAESRSEFLKMTKELGILPGQLGALNMAAKLTDVSVEGMQTGMGKLEKAMAAAAVGKNKDVAGLFQHLKISLTDGHGHIKSITEVLPQLADAFRKTTDPAMRMRAAIALFGRDGKELIPMLMEGSEGLREFAAISKQVNYAPTKEEGEGLEEFHKQWILMQSAVTGVSAAIGAKLAPVLAPVVELAREWVVANRDWVATMIADKVKQLADWVKTLNLREIIDQIQDWIHASVSLTSHVGGLKTMLGAAILVMGSPLLSALSSVINMVGQVGRILIWVSSIAWANPILAAIGAVIVGGYLLYENWDWVKEKVGAVFTWFSGQGGWVKALITIVAPFIAIPAMIVEHWEPLKAFFVELWEWIRRAFSDAWSYIQPIIEKINGAVDALQNSYVGKYILGLVSDVTVPQTVAPTGGIAPGAAPGVPGVDIYTPPLESPYREGNGAAPVTSQDGKTQIQIDINGLPPGSTVRSQSSGAAPAPDLNVGYAMPLGLLGIQ
jgi:hypothetical protein